MLFELSGYSIAVDNGRIMKDSANGDSGVKW